MRYGSAAAFRTALEARLGTLSRSTDLNLVRLRKSVVFARLLARLLAVAPDRWVLKGGLAIDYRFGPGMRTTKDMDLGRADGEEAATEDLLAAQAMSLDDFFTYEIESTGRLDEIEGVSAVRYHVRCLLAGRLFEEVVVDVGFDLPSGWEPETVEGPDLLGFAEIAAVQVPTLPLELQVAEKVHAYTRQYGPGRASTRVKDLIDLVLIGRAADLDGDTLRRALRDTFEGRAQHEVPATFPDPPPDWTVPYAKLAREVGLPTELADGARAAAGLLNPILDRSIKHGVWNHEPRQWIEGE